MNNVMRKRYTSDFKAQAKQLVELGKPVPEVAEELGIGTSILYRWTQGSRQAAQVVGAVPRAVGEADETDELRRLRKENAHLRLENDILKKAAVILGTQTPGRSDK